MIHLLPPSILLYSVSAIIQEAQKIILITEETGEHLNPVDSSKTGYNYISVPRTRLLSSSFIMYRTLALSGIGDIGLKVPPETPGMQLSLMILV